MESQPHLHLTNGRVATPGTADAAPLRITKANKKGTTHRCLTPSNRFDFFTAKTSVPRAGSL